MPDVHMVWSGLMFWIELKTTKHNAVNLSPQQIAWNTAYSRSGGLSFILVKHLSSGDIILFRGSDALEIGRKGLAFGDQDQGSGTKVRGSGALYRGSGHRELWQAVRASGSSHLGQVLAGLRGDGPVPGLVQDKKEGD